MPTQTTFLHTDVEDKVYTGTTTRLESWGSYKHEQSPFGLKDLARFGFEWNTANSDLGPKAPPPPPPPPPPLSPGGGHGHRGAAPPTPSRLMRVELLKLDRFTVFGHKPAPPCTLSAPVRNRTSLKDKCTLFLISTKGRSVGDVPFLG